MVVQRSVGMNDNMAGDVPREERAVEATERVEVLPLVVDQQAGNETPLVWVVAYVPHL